MRILIPNNKLRHSLEGDKARQRQFGIEMAKKIRLRMEALAGAETLGDFWPPYDPPERLHELKGDMAGHFSMDLKHPFRFLFRAIEPRADKTSVKALADFERWRSIDTIEVIAIEDTHG
jgi:proteic killer suppression protein